VRQIRMLRAKRRELETGLRHLLHGHAKGKPLIRPRSGLRITAPVPDPSAAMLAAVPAGGSPADGSRPAAIVVILGDGKGDRLVGSPSVNVSVGWERIPVGSAREASKSTGRSKSEPM
jgi:hypothetical protein